MPDSKNDVHSSATRLPGGKYTAEAAPRHRSALRRLFFFALSAVWGCIVGIAGLLASMNASGQRVDVDSGSVSGIIAALVVAAGGSLVIAGAYRESKRHSR